jgi:methyl-accepting chemotaxis protein
MNTTTAQPAESPAARPAWWSHAATASLLAGGAAAAWVGGWLGLLGAAALAWGVLRAGPATTAGRRIAPVDGEAPAAAETSSRAAANAAIQHASAGTGTGNGNGRRPGAELMIDQVVPVWSRQLEVTRDQASDGLSNILQAFSDINTALQTLASNLSSFKVTAAPGAVDGAVRSESPALQALTAASSRAFAERDAALAELTRCHTGLAELQQLAKQARALARHTRLVAFNASIESSRQPSGPAGAGGAKGPGTEGGSQAVATELRMLAGRLGETGEKIERVVNSLAGAIRKAHREGELGLTSPEALRLEIDLCARDALAALLAALGTSVHSGGEVQQAAAQLSEQVENIFVQFQFGDRVSQMLSIVANDMANFAQWVVDHPQATPGDAAEWLTALESSYTMEEQRSTHHGNVHIDAGAAVEFF